MRSREGIRAIYEQGPEAVLVLVEPLPLRLAQPQEQGASRPGYSHG
jgi:hypothetical protein